MANQLQQIRSGRHTQRGWCVKCQRSEKSICPPILRIGWVGLEARQRAQL
jgi:hypothetical protein